MTVSFFFNTHQLEEGRRIPDWTRRPTPGPPFRVSRALTGLVQTSRANLPPAPYPNPHEFSFSHALSIFGRRVPVPHAEVAHEMALVFDADP